MNEMKFPLTHPQKRILYNETIFYGTAVHNIGGTVTIKGLVDIKMLREAIQSFIIRNPSLSTVLIKEGEVVYQKIEMRDPEVGFIDFNLYSNPDLEFKKWVKKESEMPFKLFDATLYSLIMFRKNRESGYFIKLHHIIADGWSVQILTEQITKIYEELIHNSSDREHCEITSYFEFAEREKMYLQSGRFEKDKQFWNNQFKDLPEVFLQNSSSDLKGSRKEYQLDQTLSESIRLFLRDHGFSMNAFFVSVFLIYFHKIYQQNDLIIGTPVLNRSGKREKRIFGMFTSSMPFRTEINEDETFINYLKAVNRDLKKSFLHQRYPYNVLVHDLELRKKGYNDLFKICMNYYNTKHPTEFGGNKVENDEFYNGYQFYSLQMVIKEWEEVENIHLLFDYKIHDYTEDQIENMFESIKNVIRYVIKHEVVQLRDISLLAGNELEKVIYEYNHTNANYPKDKTVNKLFEEQANRTPRKVAVQIEGETLTFEELNKKANQAARFLQSKCSTKNSLIGVMMEPSTEMIAMLLGILKSGAAYLPIDANYPVERINYMIDNSDISLIVSNVKNNKIDYSGEFIDLDHEDIFYGEDTNLDIESSSHDLAYVMYTSGSTGKPKGTMVHHQGLVNYVWWANSVYTHGEEEIFPLYSSLSFDLTVTSIFVPLIGGHQIVVYKEDESEFILFKILRENLATIIKLTPAHLTLMNDEDHKDSSIRKIIVGGEDLKVQLAREIYESFGGKVKIYNEYGPTETIVGCMIHKYDYHQDTGISVPIGKPANNVKVYVLDQHLQPLPVHSVGELYISGDGVTKGYLHNPSLTKERFIKNPFISDTLMYKTGDLTRWLENGKMEYIGRIDRQIILRGYRIELREIEHHLLQVNGVENAVVVLNGENEDKSLCAYLKTNKSITERELEIELLKELPEYMIPTYFIQLEEIPLDKNGKINQNELPLPPVNNSESKDKHERTEYEKVLVQVMEEVLQRNFVQVTDNFYQLGGDSIKAIQVVSKLKERGYSIKVKHILSNPEIKYMALFLEEVHTYHTEEISEEPIAHLPITRWFFSQEFFNENYFNQSVLLKLKKPILLEDLNRTFSYIIKYHDSLRINYNQERDELLYNNDLINTPFHVQSYELCTVDKVQPWEQIEVIGEKLKSEFDITKDLLIKVALIIMDNDNQYLLLTAHHLVIDGVSWRILFEDVCSLLNHIQQDKQLTLSPKTASYQKWAESYHEWGKAIDSKEQHYWENIKRVNFEIPVDYQTNNNYYTQDKYTFKLSEEDTQLLVSKANHAYNTDTNTLLIISLGLAIHEFFEKGEIVIELEGHGREEIGEQLDLSRTIGWFTSMYPILLNYNKEEKLPQRIKEWKQIISSIPNKGIGYGYLQYLKGENGRLDNTQIRFNFLGDFDSSFSNDYFSWSDLPSGLDSHSANQATAVLEINALIVDGTLQISTNFNKEQYHGSTIANFSNVFLDKLIKIIHHCVNQDEINYTPSDFDTISMSQDELDQFLK